VQIARQGWGEQKSQNGGANPALSGPATTSYHLWSVAPEAKVPTGVYAESGGLFYNPEVRINTRIQGLAGLAAKTPPQWLTDQLHQIADGIERVEHQGKALEKEADRLVTAHALASVCRQTITLRSRVAGSGLEAQSKASLLFELDAKINEIQVALKELLGLDLTTFVTRTESVQGGGPFRSGSADETPRGVTPGEEFRVRVHTAQATGETKLEKVWLMGPEGRVWKSEDVSGTAQSTSAGNDQILSAKVAENAPPTAPYFTRPNIEQAYYDLTRPEDRLRSFEPYPLSAWAEFTFDGLPIRLGQVVQTMQRVPGVGGVYEPLVVTPAIGVRMEPEARILPLDGAALPVKVTVHAQSAAKGTVELKLPAGWRSDPAQALFHREAAGDTEPILFSVTPAATEAAAYSIQAVAHAGGHEYKTGWQSVGYTGLRPYNQYKAAELKTRKVDVKLATGLRIGYVMGTGDTVPEAIEGLGATAHLLSAKDLATGDLSQWNAIVIGIRAYSARPELAAAQPRLNEFVRRGGTLVVEYQDADFPAPLPLSMGRSPEKVVEEAAPVRLLNPANSLLRWPNLMTAEDFNGWVEERGHSFLTTWDPGYEPLTETADQGQDPQKGGLLIAHPGKGTYIYVAYALYRQLPELVPGSYRLLANLLSAGQDRAANAIAPQAPRP